MGFVMSFHEDVSAQQPTRTLVGKSLRLSAPGRRSIKETNFDTPGDWKAASGLRNLTTQSDRMGGRRKSGMY